MTHTHDDSQLDGAWQEAWQHPFYTQGAASWISSVDSAQLSKSFADHGGVLMCIDEGVEPGEGENAVYLAGSGILFQKDQHKDPEVRRKKLMEELKGKKITGVTSHQSCGACALFCTEAGTGVPEDVAQEWAKKLAEDLGVPYIGHVHPSKRPHFHNALIAYYDGTGCFIDPSRSGLPTGFIVSRALISDAVHAAYELELASKIAMGAHGFGDRFSENQPFHFAVIVDPDHPELTEEKLLSEVEPILKSQPKFKKVVIRKPRKS